MDFYAHSGREPAKSDWQPLADHLRNVAARAADYARSLGLERAAFLAGLLHDLGKYAPAFQRRLEGAPITVDHSTAGAVVALDLVRGQDAAMAELIAQGGADRNPSGGGVSMTFPVSPLPRRERASCRERVAPPTGARIET